MITIRELLAETLSEKRARAGRKGGMANLAANGREHFSEIGRKGGRPRLPSIEELMATRKVTL